MKLQYQTSIMDTRDVDVALGELRPAANGLPGAAPKPPSAQGYAMPYADGQRSSRTDALAAGPMELLWRTELPAGATPRFVLQSGGVTAVHGTGWHSFAGHGRLLASGPGGPGPACADGSTGLLYSIDHNGLLAVNLAETGKRRFFVMTAAGDNGGYTFMHCGARNVLLAAFPLRRKGNFEQMNRSAPPPPAAAAESILELVQLPADTSTAQGGLLETATSIVVRIPGALLQVARTADRTVFASDGAIVFADGALQPVRAFATGGQPRALSLDAAGRAYLVIDRAGRRELLQIGPGGELGYALTLPPARDAFPAPPALGREGTVFVAAGSQLLSIDSRGREIWSRTVAGGIVGLSVMADGNLLVSEGGALARYESNGDRKQLFDFAGERLSTPPVVTPAGGVLVASQKALLALGRR